MLHEGGAGLIDLSVGKPGDPPPPDVLAALGSSGAERGYPPSAGSLQLRQAALSWMSRRFGVELPADSIAACIGTKEMVASSAWYLRLRSPGRDTVLHPALSYPTYAMSATLAGCRSVGVPEAPGGGVDLGAIDPDDAGRALVLWVNSPANPTGRLTDLGAAAAWGRENGVPVFSDECYVELTWARPPESILQHGREGLLAVHSLSKRSNLAGVRVGFYAGDAELVGYLSEVRKHAGLMVPGPAQLAGVHALVDDRHVAEQRGRYRHRLERLAGALGSAGVACGLPDGGFYLWVEAPEWARDSAGSMPAWVLAEALAEAAGILVSPGDFYGEAGSKYVRVAAVQPDERIEEACRRLEAVGTLGPGKR